MTCRRRQSSAKRTVTFSLLLAMLAISSAVGAPTTSPDLPKHDKLVVPQVLAQSGTIVPGKYLVEFSRPPAANVAAQRRERASQQSLEQGVNEQQESFGVYCRRNRIPIKVNRRYIKLWNGVSANVESVEDLKKVLDAPGVVKVYPVVQQFAPEQPQIIKDPVLPQFAHNLTNMHLVQAKYPELTGKNIKVGVIDSGIDWKHPAFAIPGQKCETFKGPGCRVLYGWDFVGDSYNSGNRSAPAVPDSDPLDCGGHGTHVAGIIGGYDDKIKGVAPEAVFGAYRVFGCDGTTDNAVIMAALEQSFQDGMELINMSLGGAHIGADSPYAQAIDNLVTNGVHVIAAASNSGENGLSYTTAPSIASKAFSIASFDNTHNYETAAELTNVPDLTTVTFGYSTSNGITGRFDQGKKSKLIRSPNPPTSDADGCAPFPANHFAGGVALVRRGGCAFTDKAVAAFSAGAEGVVIYNNKPAALSGGVLDAAKVGARAVGFIAGDDGEKIWNAAAAGTVEVTFNNQPEFRRSRTAGLPSGFSSWGLDVNLRLRPDYGAPGEHLLGLPTQEGWIRATFWHFYGLSLRCWCCRSRSPTQRRFHW
ncbi:peptidase S8/S53 domain-containing protein [Catenaria anguillulae PL171]|uniref:Peptidase S8/S53 domain-containing protein n=1 Tax=Catenaria anguillulae PL171 TaxID=765915 RepID=A0A1Y2I3G3_9FUNG|nr:peptidase S8/S53 domain-containing protein [Catenaria anguillulae PL171]